MNVMVLRIQMLKKVGWRLFTFRMQNQALWKD